MSRAKQQRDKERDQRARALETLAHQAGTRSDAPSSPQGSRRLADRFGRRRGRGAALIGALVLVMILLAGGFAFHLISSASGDIPSQLTLNLQAAGFGCPTALAWSPDASEIAIVAAHAKRGTQQPDCSQSSPISDEVLLFDAKNGTLLKHYAIGISGQNQYVGVDLAGTLSWSPDGTELAVSVNVAAAPSGSKINQGILVIPTGGGSSRVIDGPIYSDSTNIWDLRTGQPSRLLSLPLPPARTYQWTPDGRIMPDQPLPGTPTANTFAGSPVRDAKGDTFSLWQAGVLHTIKLVDVNGLPTGMAEELYDARAATWSSDGAYMIANLPLLARVDPQQGTGQAPNDQTCQRSVPIAEWCQAPLVALPDPAFAGVAARASNAALSGTGAVLDIPFTWRPDGKVLAAVLPGDGILPGHQTIQITLYNSGGRTPVSTLSVPEIASYQQGPLPVLAWSPDGQRFAAADPRGAAVTIFGAGKLPQ